MIEQKLISIIIPIYNASEFLEECLCSIKKQVYSNFEVICVDDGSTDNSAEIALKFTESDKRFRLYRQPNSGVSVARNTGLKHATGDYICFVDADDMVAPDYLSVLYNHSKDGDFTICGYTKDVKQLGNNECKVNRYSSKKYISKIIDESVEHPNLWAMMFKAEIVKKFKIEFYPGCVRNEDTEFYMKYLVHEVGNVVCTDYKGYFYRDNPNSAMHVTKRNAFTSFGASERMEKYLADYGIIMNYNKMLYSSIQAYSVVLARERNKDLYDELHSLYDVRKVMCKLLKHPRFIRRVVAFVYFILGESFYYKVLGVL